MTEMLWSVEVKRNNEVCSVEIRPYDDVPLQIRAQQQCTIVTDG